MLDVVCVQTLERTMKVERTKGDSGEQANVRCGETTFTFHSLNVRCYLINYLALQSKALVFQRLEYDCRTMRGDKLHSESSTYIWMRVKIYATKDL